MQDSCLFDCSSGRVSKPPSHMVKDYKQIHRVDWYEDYDDDDGGYSDIYDSDQEINIPKGALVLCSSSRDLYLNLLDYRVTL